MTLKDFIDAFSHNNEIYIENRENYCMQYSYVPGDRLRDMLMDWEAVLTDIKDVEVISIKNVLRPYREQGITIKIDTDRKTFAFVKEDITEYTAPLWLYNRVHQTNIAGCEGS